MGRKKRGPRMEKIFEYVSKNPRKVLVGAIILVALLLFLSFRFFLVVHFLLTDDLLLSVVATTSAVSGHHSDIHEIGVTVEVEKTLFCEALCNYTFFDIRAGSELDSGSFSTVDGQIKLEKEYEVEAGRVGTGQNLYHFEAICTNIRTSNCLTDGSSRKRTALITLDYGLSETEESAKTASDGLFRQLFGDIQSLDENVQGTFDQFNQLQGQLNVNSEVALRDNLLDSFTVLRLEVDRALQLWRDESYEVVLDELSTKIPIRFGKVELDVDALSDSLESNVASYQQAIADLDGTYDFLVSVNRSLDFAVRADNDVDDKIVPLLASIRQTQFELGQLGDARSLQGDIDGITSTANFINGILLEVFAPAFADAVYYNAVQQDVLCAVKGQCTDIVDVTQVNFSKEYSLQDECSALSATHAHIRDENSKALLLRTALTDQERSLVDQYAAEQYFQVEADIRRATVNHPDNVMVDLLLAFDVRRVANQTYPLTIGNATMESLMLMNISDTELDFIADFCGPIATPTIDFPELVPLDAVAVPEPLNYTSNLVYFLSTNAPQCCVDGQCQTCCADRSCDDRKELPVILLHGHTFNADTAPDFSLDALNALEQSLADAGYLVGPTVSASLSIEEPDWSKSPSPFVIKASYYLVSFYDFGRYAISTQKSENIETYSIRLKEIIDTVKSRTGSDQVNIVAHSMGGLVARSYMQIFGATDINTLVTIGTPHQGTTGTVSGICPLIGTKKECEDMDENSVFIKRLNDPNSAQNNEKIVSIIGSGCDTDGVDGDGVVRADNARLVGAQNVVVEGTCQRIELPLHNTLLDVGQHPSVLSTILQAFDIS